MCLPAFADSTAARSKVDSIRPQVQLPAPHTTLTAGRCQLSLDLWKRIAGPWHIQADPRHTRRMVQRTAGSQQNLPLSKVSGQASPRSFMLAQTHFSIISPSAKSALYRISPTVRECGPPSSQCQRRAPTRSGGCIDLTTINSYLNYEHFRMEDLRTVQPSSAGGITYGRLTCLTSTCMC